MSKVQRLKASIEAVICARSLHFLASSVSSRCSLPYCCALGTSALIVFSSCAYLWFVMSSGRFYPYSDEWHFIGPIVEAEPQSPGFCKWLLSLHGDHRIPLPKMYYVVLLKLGHFDFRTVLLVNGLVLAVGCQAIVGSLRASRDRAELGDLVVPLLVWGAGFTMIWGMGIQFISSTLLLIGFGLAAGRFGVDRRKPAMRVGRSLVCSSCRCVE